MSNREKISELWIKGKNGESLLNKKKEKGLLDSFI